MKIRFACLALLIGWLPAVLYLSVMFRVPAERGAIAFLVSYTSIIAVALFVAMFVSKNLDQRQVHPASLIAPPCIGFLTAFIQFRASTSGIDVGISFTTAAIFSFWGAIFGLGSAITFRYIIHKEMKTQQTRAANSRASGTSGMSDAEASAPPEASGNS